jgi:hypothetical protein
MVLLYGRSTMLLMSSISCLSADKGSGLAMSLMSLGNYHKRC